MVYVGMDVHQVSTTFCFYDPRRAEGARFRTLTVHTTAETIRAALAPLDGRCRVAFEVGSSMQWVAAQVRPLAQSVHVANASRMPWLFRDGRKNDRLDARKLATLLALEQLPEVHLPSPEVSAWRALINHRRRLIQRRTRTKNQIRAILRTFVRRCPHRSCWSRVGRVWLRSQSF
ncbi:MAG: transposase, partial [Phycisphaerae bacterium]